MNEETEPPDLEQSVSCALEIHSGFTNSLAKLGIIYDPISSVVDNSILKDAIHLDHLVSGIEKYKDFITKVPGYKQIGRIELDKLLNQLQDTISQRNLGSELFVKLGYNMYLLSLPRDLSTILRKEILDTSLQLYNEAKEIMETESNHGLNYITARIAMVTNDINRLERKAY